jgi:hypothetical protein
MEVTEGSFTFVDSVLILPCDLWTPVNSVYPISMPPLTLSTCPVM